MGVGIVNPGSHQVGGKQIRRKLQAGEIRIERLAQGFDRQRLRQSRNPFDQDVPAGHQRHQQAVDQAFLSGDDPPHFSAQRHHEGGFFAQLRLQFGKIRLIHITPLLLFGILEKINFTRKRPRSKPFCCARFFQS
ncbi:hypothetical protein SDC9_174824 [bioreactor metagenome]|uniref:Uncharacterized protein n=1 Tax=bioreactor metagenome TaxID=1076179 RepID=A0A645GNC3_9ZZZZ